SGRAGGSFREPTRLGLGPPLLGPDRGADPVHRARPLDEDLRGDALSFPHQPEQDVLGADGALLQLERLPQGELEHLLGAWRERDVTLRAALTPPDDVVDVGPDSGEPDPEEAQRSAGRAVRLAEQAEQQVLGADVAVTEPSRLFLGEDDGRTGRRGEAL